MTRFPRANSISIIPYLVVGRVEPSHRQVLVRDDVGQPLRRREEDVVGDVPDAGADHAQGHAREDVRVVALIGGGNNRGNSEFRFRAEYCNSHYGAISCSQSISS